MTALRKLILVAAWTRASIHNVKISKKKYFKIQRSRARLNEKSVKRDLTGLSIKTSFSEKMRLALLDKTSKKMGGRRRLPIFMER